MTRRTTHQPARDRAVVIGASMAGLLAARVLTDHFADVVLVERDALPSELTPRRGVPQGRHVHSLLGAGDAVLRELFPGIRDDYESAGAESALSAGQLRFVTPYGVLPRLEVTEPALCATRPLIEDVVRRRVLSHPAVALMEETDASGVVADWEGRVRGVRVFPRLEGVERELTADLVVDASGRSGRSVAWLEALGHGRPPEDTIHSNLGYVTRRYRLAAEPGGDRFVVVTASEDRPFGMAAGIVEGDSWMVTVFGYGQHRPAPDEQALLDALARTAPPDLFAAIRDGEPLGPVESHRTPTSIRRRYEKMRSFPSGLVVFGDALCAFNPIYGQGMTVAAQQAMALRTWLRSGGDDPRAFFRLAAPVVGAAWDIVAVADLSVPEVPGPRPLSVRLIGRYLDRVMAVAVHDDAVAAAYFRVVNLLDPPSALMRPGVAIRVLGCRRAPRTEALAARSRGLDTASR